jgi:hypothetical protein
LETAYYYLYSTIAQTLGGGLALLAAFVIFRMQSLEKSLAADTGSLTVLFEGDPIEIKRFNELRAEENYEEIVRLIQIDSEQPGFGDRAWPLRIEFGALRARLRAHSLTRGKIRRSFARALWLSLIAIATSVVAILLVPLLASNAFGFFLAVGLTVEFLVCAASYWFVLRRGFKLDPAWNDP